MATLQWLILATALLCADSFPQWSLRKNIQNTIFGDEKLEGEVFEDIDAFSDISMFTDFTTNPYRLPNDTVPIHYDILWAIDLDPLRLSYEGTVNIQLRATRAGVSEIVLHSDHHEIYSIQLTQGNNTIPVTNSTQEQYHFLRIRPNADLLFSETNPIVYNLIISFGASMRTDMYGIYSSWFRNNHTEQPNWMASTQFQGTSARYAFPCYDEPKFKATFSVTIRRQAAFRSWSAMRINQTVPSSIAGWEDDIYHTTPIMSTYLLALIVADYQSIESNNANGELMYEVIARPGAIQSGQGQYAFDVGQVLLANMSAHTDWDFYTVPNIKMTQAAIPDFSAGAMENWGLLTYREAYLLYDEVHTSSYNKQLIAYILSHEIAHMWFGNLVTNDWWDVLWLNEGFARYYQYFLTHWVETEMGFETRFITEQVHTALLSDSANNPQPLSNPGVGSTAAVSAMFSTISYNKGAAIIRMTEHFLGFAVHELGLQNYLKAKQFDVALPIDLFTYLQAAGYERNALQQYGSEFNFTEYYYSWTDQPGHPVLNVQVDHSTGRMTVTQRRFNINTGYSSINTHYVVPITFATASNPDFTNTKPTHVLRDTVMVIDRGTVGDEWVIFNKQQTGYYRVNYDDYTWDLIAIALQGSAKTTIHEYNRAQIVNDIFQFARSGLMTYTRAFSLLSFLANETDYAPWVAAMTGFTWIRNRLAGTSQLTQIQNLIASWAQTVMNEIGYYPSANESFMRSYLRWQLAPVMCNINVAACRSAALAQFRNLVDNGVEVPADSRNWVYCNGLRQGSTTDFNVMWTRFLQHNVYTEKITLLQTLGCTPHASSLTIFLDNIVEENYVIRPQDYTTAWNTAVTGNEENTMLVLNYLRNGTNLQTVMNAFGGARTPLSYIASRLRTEADIATYQSWVTQNQAILGNEYTGVLNDAESSRESIRWAAAVATDINEYVVGGGDNISTSTSSPLIPVQTSTVAMPVLVEPVAPSIPDSASSIILSMTLIAFAVMTNFMF